MKNTKFVKARCSKTNEAFALEVKQQGSAWKVVDFVQLTDQQDAKLESQIDVDSLTVADSIQSCSKCGSRRVGGCNCHAACRGTCKKGAAYDYQCIFCKNMQLDYSEASECREGEQVTLSQGQVITLSQRGVSISQLMVGMGWKPSRTSDNMDLDASVILIGRDGSILEKVYYARLKDDAESIVHHGDNLTGSEKINNETDDETISINLNSVPSKVEYLAFIVNIYRCAERNQTFGDVEGVHIRLIESTKKKSLAKYNTFANDRKATGLLIGIAYRSRGKWAFKAMGNCYKVGDIDQLARYSAEECKKISQ